MTVMAVLDWAVFGVLGSFAIGIFYVAFSKAPKKHQLGGEGDAEEADDGTPAELGIRDEFGASAAASIDRD